MQISTILILLIIILYLINKKQNHLSNKLEHLSNEIQVNMDKQINKLSSFTHPNRNLDIMLDYFNKNYTDTKKINKFNVLNTYVYTKTNIVDNLRTEVKYLTQKILNIINHLNKTKYVDTDVENVYVSNTIENYQFINVIFFIYETNKYSGRKVILSYLKKDNNHIDILNLESLQSIVNNSKNDIKNLLDKNLNKINKWNLYYNKHLIKTLIETQNQYMIQSNTKQPINKETKHVYTIFNNVPYTNPTLFNNNVVSKNKY